MSPISLTSGLLALGLLACSPSKGALEPDTGAADVESADAGHGDDEESPSACVEGQACPIYGERCIVNRTHCHCTSPCSGVELPPEQNFSRWACREVDPKCPEAIPEQGERCRPEGLRCGWGTCGGTSAVCEGHSWSVQSWGPPP